MTFSGFSRKRNLGPERRLHDAVAFVAVVPSVNFRGFALGRLVWAWTQATVTPHASRCQAGLWAALKKKVSSARVPDLDVLKPQRIVAPRALGRLCNG